MSDNDIKKALECCSSSTGAEACKGCPFNEKDICDKEDDAPQKYALDLINRLQAENENLKHNLKCVKDHKEGLIERLQKILDDKCDKCIARDRAEAIKEFAERVETALDERVSEKIRERNPHWYLAKRIARETVIEMTEQ